MSSPSVPQAAPFAAILEQLWEARHDGDVVVRFAGGKPQYVELVTAQRIRCAEKLVEYAHARVTSRA